MEPILSRERLPEVVAEVDRLADARGGLLDRKDTEAVLREVGLPAELLDEAMAEIERRDRKKQRGRRHLVMTVAMVVVLAGAAAWGMHLANARSSAHAAITSQNAHVALGNADATSTTTVPRDGTQDVFFVADLVSPPLGESLALRCTWVDGSGKLVRESRYETKPINLSVWPTHCKTRLGQGADAGTWRVTMVLGDRALATTTFDVR